MTTPVRIYLDTSVVLDYIERTRGNPHAVALFSEIFDGLNVVAVTSTYAIMEAVQKRQDSTHARELLTRGYTLDEIRGEHGRNRELTLPQCIDCFNDVTRPLSTLGKKLEIRRPSGERFWDDALALVKETNISAPDSLHVAMARDIGCAALISGDGQLVRELARLGFRKTRVHPILCQRSTRLDGLRRQLRSRIAAARRAAAPATKKVPPEARRVIRALASIGAQKKPLESAARSYETRLLRLAANAKRKRS